MTGMVKDGIMLFQAWSLNNTKWQHVSKGELPT